MPLTSTRLADDYCVPGFCKLAGAVVCDEGFACLFPLTIIRMTVPPNALASLSIWFTVWLSSRYNVRAPFIIGSAFVAIIGTCSITRSQIALTSCLQGTSFSSRAQPVRISCNVENKVTEIPPSWRPVRRGPLCCGWCVHWQCIALKVSRFIVSQWIVFDAGDSWPGENVSGQTKRAIALAMQISIGAPIFLLSSMVAELRCR